MPRAGVMNSGSEREYGGPCSNSHRELRADTIAKSIYFSTRYGLNSRT